MHKKQCQNCSKTFSVHDREVEFYERMEVPEPRLCPDCRHQRRLAFRNERYLYERKCDKCGKDMISQYSPDKDYTVYCHDCWYSDDWDAREYGQDFDFSRKFFDQFDSLFRKVPLLNLVVADSQNSEYSNYSWKNRNVYLTYDAGKCENVFYSRTIYKSKDCFDCLNIFKNCELCYECVYCNNCFNSRFLVECNDMTDCSFCFDCSGCTDCMFCFNKKNASHCFGNKQLSKEEYEKKASEYFDGSGKGLETAKKEFLERKNRAVHRYAKNVNCENSVGNYMRYCKDCYHVFGGNYIDNGRYVFEGADPGGRDIMDDNFSGWGAELTYETIGIPEPYHSRFLVSTGYPKGVDYAVYGQNNRDCFGIIGLIKQANCILNKKYGEREYGEMRKKIIRHMKRTGEWGEFFPVAISPFAYNETLADEIFPLKADAVKTAGYKYKPREEREYRPSDYEIPDRISDVADGILDAVLACGDCGKNYRIIRPELDFYRAHNLPIPKKCPECRHLNRRKQINPPHLWHRRCMCTQPDHGHEGRCPNEFETTYSPERKELVYCEECYNEEIY